jgi:hypothetical protein
MAAGSTERTSGYFGDQTPSESKSFMANCIKTLNAYYGRPTSYEKVFPSSSPWSVRTVAPPKLTLRTII